MKKKRTEYESKDENAFALSTGDLMASLLFIFIFPDRPYSGQGANIKCRRRLYKACIYF